MEPSRKAAILGAILGVVILLGIVAGIIIGTTGILNSAAGTSALVGGLWVLQTLTSAGL